MTGHSGDKGSDRTLRGKGSDNHSGERGVTGHSGKRGVRGHSGEDEGGENKTRRLQR